MKLWIFFLIFFIVLSLVLILGVWGLKFFFISLLFVGIFILIWRFLNCCKRLIFFVIIGLWVWIIKIGWYFNIIFNNFWVNWVLDFIGW